MEGMDQRSVKMDMLFLLSFQSVQSADEILSAFENLLNLRFAAAILTYFWFQLCIWLTSAGHRCLYSHRLHKSLQTAIASKQFCHSKFRPLYTSSKKLWTHLDLGSSPSPEAKA